MSKLKRLIKKPIIKLALLAVVLIFSFSCLRHNFSAQASDEEINLYPQSFSFSTNAADLKNPNLKSGSLWQNPERALSAEQGQLDGASAFSENNSAALNFGQGVLSVVVATTSQENIVTSTANEIATGTTANLLVGSQISSSSPALLPQLIDADSASLGSTDSSSTDNSSPVQNYLPENNSVPADNSAGSSAAIPSADNNSVPVVAPVEDNISAPADSAPSTDSSAVPDNSNTSVDSAPAPTPVDVDAPASGSSDAPVSVLNNFKSTAGEISKFWQNMTSASQVFAQEAADENLSGSNSTSSAMELKDGLIFSDFSVDSYSPNSEINNVQLRLSLSAQSTFTFDHLLVEYSTGGDWQTAGDLFLKGGASNATNGGYFLYALPVFNSWDDINNLRVRVSYENNELSATDLQTKAAKVYLDGIWLEVDYNQGLVKAAREKNSDQNIAGGQEKHFFNNSPLIVDNKEIDFPYTDATTSESLIIKTDKQNYSGFNNAPVYFSVTNNGDQAENFGLQAYFPASDGNMVDLAKLNRQYVTADQPVIGSRIFYCAAGWQAASSTEKSSSSVPQISEQGTSTATLATTSVEQATSSQVIYSCIGKNKIRECDSLSNKEKDCLENNVNVGTSTETSAVDQWNKTNVVAGRLADKRNILQKIFNLGPHRKSVPGNFVAKAASAAGQFNIQPGETEYFKMNISFTPETTGEFYLETVGDKSGYGLLDPWWNASWNYSVPVTVTYAGANPLTNFQVPVTIGTAALIAASKMKSDCSDIAFSDTNQYTNATELNYYLEPGTCNTAYTKVWVNVPSISATKKIYLYYGNSAATSFSSGANTFVYFNDFETAAGFNSGLLNSIQYAKSAKYGSYGLNANAATHDRLETISGSASGRNLIWETWVKAESSSTVSALPGVAVGHTAGNTALGYQAMIDTRGTHSLSITKDFGTTTPAVFVNGTVNTNTWYFLSFNWRSTGVLWAYLYAGSTSTTPLLNCSTTDATYSNGEYGVGAYQIGDWDNYRVRKYASSSVATALGQETQIIDHAPANPSALAQYQQNTSLVLGNGNWTTQNTVNLFATSTDKDLDGITMYYNLATTSGSYVTATSAPATICQSGTAYASCPSRIWTNTNSSGWFDSRWSYREKITFGTSHSLLPAGYTASTTMDTRPANTHVALTSGNDVLIVWQSSTTPPVEIDRIGDTWNSATTHISFKIQTAVAANTNEANAGSYYVYYGNASAGTPPVNPAKVYYEYDPFNQGALGSEWTTIDKSNTGVASFVVTSTLKIASIGTDIWTANDNYAGIYRTIPGNFEVTTDVQSQTATNAWTKTGIMIKNNMAVTQANNGYFVMSVTPSNNFSDQWDSTADGYLDTNAAAGTTAYPDCLRVVKNGTTFTSYYSTNCSTYTAMTAVTLADTNTASQNVGLFNTSHDAALPSSSYFNWIKVRLLVAADENATQATEEAYGTWYNSSYLYRQPIVVQSSQVAAAQTNFPVYLNMARLGASNNFWSHTKSNSDGGDILITNLSGTRLPVEIVSLSTSTKSGEVYFNADSLSSTANTTFYLYYGSSTASQPASSTTYGKQNVWSNGYIGVWHYQENNPGSGSVGAFKDSTSGNNPGTSYVAATGKTGKLGSGQQFNGTSDYVLIPSFSFGGAITVSGWINYSAFNNWSRLIDFGSGAPSNNIFVANNGTTQDLRFGIANGSTEVDLNVTGAWLAAGNWQYFTGTVNAAGNMAAYINGASVGSNANTTVLPSVSRSNQYVGRSNWSGDSYFSGYQDELRLSNTNRSATWITTEYNNQNSPGTFIATTTEQASPSASKFVKIPSIPDSSAGYKWQALACDSQNLCSSWSSFNTSIPNFRIDTVVPNFNGNTLTFLASTTNSIKIKYATTTEANFYQYKLFYQLGSTTPVHENATWSITSSTPGYSYFSDRNLLNKSSTTITGLATGTVYSFVLWAYDQAGNKSSSTLKWQRTDRSPSSLIFNSASEQTNGSGKVNVSFTVGDQDLDTQLMAQVDYAAGSCHGATFSKATLSQVGGDTTASFGGPVVQNKNKYQIGTSTGWITTSPSANTVNTIWSSQSDLPAGDGTYCLQVVANDNKGGYTIATTSLIIDNVKPVMTASSLTYANKRTGASITATFGSAATETNFYQYKIYYKTGSPGVKQTNSLFGSSTVPGDLALFSKTYLTHTTTTISGLVGNVQYYFNIFAYDNFGNVASATNEMTATTLVLPANASGWAQYLANGSTAISNNTWITSNEVKLYATSTESDAAAVTMYYQLATTSGAYISATTTPVNVCSSGTAYNSCSSRIWSSSGSTKADIPGISDFNGYKWQVLGCSANGCAREWTQFNSSAPNFKVNAVAPTPPGSLTFNSKGANNIVLNFGSQTVTSNFTKYKIFYKQGIISVKQTDSLWGSSSDASLGYINYNGNLTTNITGLANGANYVFNIFAYDAYGRVASGTTEIVVNLGSGPGAPYGLLQYDYKLNPLLNTTWTASSTVTLSATSTDANPYLVYYELLGNGSSFTTSTSTPATPCSVGTSYSSCASKIWVNGTSSALSWYDASYKYRTPITVLASQVAGSLTNFPVYFNLARLGGSNSFWSHTKKNSDGGDLIITKADGMTRLPLEVARISTSTKTGEIYFRADAISSSSNIVYYIYYGSAAATQPAPAATYGSQNVWSNGYKGVWHLNESSGATSIKDSTSYNNSSSTIVGAVTLGSSGELGTSANFNGTSRILIEHNASLEPAGLVTFSIWMNGGATQNVWAKPMWYGRNSVSPWGVYGFEYNNTSQTDMDAGISSASTRYPTSNYTITASTWNYLVGVNDGAYIRLYVNGLQRSASSSTAIIGAYDNANGLAIGDRYEAGQGFAGSVDEVRIASSSRSAKWISTEYNNQNSPATFFSTSTEQQSPGALQKTIKISGIPDSATGYKWHALACETGNLCSKNWGVFNLTTPNFKVDTTGPAFSDNVSFLSNTTNSIKIHYPTAATDPNFYQYKLFYQLGSTSPVHENATWSITSSTPGYSYFGNINFNGKSSTTITGLATGTAYSFVVWGYDTLGNKSSTTLVWQRTDRSPNVLIFNSASEQTNASGKINVSFAVGDQDLDTQLMAQLDYAAGSCHGATFSKATLSQIGGDTTATFGTPVVQNKNQYQIGTSTGWITTSPSANTVNTIWLSKTDLPAGDGTYCLQVVANDNKGGYTIATTSLIVDNVKPVMTASSLTYANKRTGASITATFGSAATESNFYQYKIYYKAGSSGVKQTDLLFGSSTTPGDSALTSKTYLSHTTTTISSLVGSTQYYFNIFAYDIYGNVASATTEMTATTFVLPVNASGWAQYLADGTTAISNNTWISSNEVKLYATSTESDAATVTMYYQLATTSGAYISATTTPVNVCSSGTAYASCPSRIWSSSGSIKADIKLIPDFNGYKWQVLSCSIEGCAREWTQFNSSVPNFKVNAVAPTIPGSLTFNSKGVNNIVLNFGSQTVTDNFAKYKIFYKIGSAGVKQTDSLWSSSSDASLGYINYNNNASTNITGLTTGVNYVFNIFAYDAYGRVASGTTEIVVNLGTGPGNPYGLLQYDYKLNSLLNNTWTASSTVTLSATSTDASYYLMYYELLGNGSSFTTATTTPASPCSVGTSYSSCSSKIWVNGISNSSWYNASYPYRAQIVIQSAKVAGSLSSFPVYFNLARLGATNSFWSHTKKNSDGGDLVVTAADGKTRLPLEVVSVSTSTKGGEIYFNVGSISSSSNATYYLYYGSSTAAQPASSTATIGSQNVWDSSFKAVFHYGASARDSTANNIRPVTNTATVNTANSIVGSSSYAFTTANSNVISYASSSALDINGVVPITVETWVDYTALAAAFQQYFNKGDTQYAFQKTSVNPGTNQFCIYDTAWECAAGNSAVATGNWYYTVGTYAGTSGGAVNYYENGVKQTAAGTATTIAEDRKSLISAGGIPVGGTTGRYSNAYVDEVRVSNVSRSAKWIATTYNNESNPGTFFATTTEQAYPVPAKTIKISGISDGTYKWHALACEALNNCSKAWGIFNAATPNFKIDTTNPSSPGQLIMLSRNTNSVTLGFTSQTSETNFTQYKIYYKAGTSGVNENNILVSSSTNTALGYQNYNGMPGVTISGLNSNTNYVFNIWAYDVVGHKASSTPVTFQTSNSVAQLYYYTGGGSSNWINPAFAWDNTNGTYSYRSVPGNSVDDSSNYLQGAVNNAAVTSLAILGVEIGVKGYTLDSNNVSYKITPLFNGGSNAGSTYTLAGSLFGRTDSGNIFYTNVTNDSKAPSTWTWNDVISLNAKLVASNASSTAVTANVDQIGLRVTVDSYPNNVTNLKQYKSDNVSVITNGTYFNQNNITLSGQATDPDTSEALSVYYQFIPVGQSFITVTTTPANACSNSNAYSDCTSKVWVASYSGTPTNFSSTPYTGTSSIAAIPDGAYKWQAMACDADNVCSDWIPSNASTPNITIDITAPTMPGNLVFSSHNSQAITLHFGSPTVDTNFNHYVIYYRTGSTTPVTINDTQQSDSNLNYINYNGAATTTITGLTKSSWYTFNIWAYDLAGNKASATVAVIASTTASAYLNQTSYLVENDDGANANLNTAPGLAGVPLVNVWKGQRLNTRFQIQNTGGDQTYNKRFKIQYENNTDAPGTWVDVGLNTPISYSYGLSGSNGDAITAAKAAANANTFSNGFWQEETNLTNMYSLALGHYTEFVFALQTANATPGKTYRLRLINGTDSVILDTYSAYPTLTIVASDTGRYSKDALASLPGTNNDLTYFLDKPGYTALSVNDSTLDGIQSSAGNYPLYDFVTPDNNSSYDLNILWNGQSSVAPTSNPITLQVYNFNTSAWVSLTSNNSTALNTNFNLSNNINYHISNYLSGGYAFWRVYQNPGAETLSSNYLSFTTSTATAYVTSNHYRWRNDDAAYGTWLEAQDAADPTLGTALNKLTNIRLRWSFINTQAGSAANYGFGLQYATTTTNCAGTLSSWYPVRSTATSTLQFQMAQSSKFTDGSSTSAQLSTDGYTYTAGRMVNYPSVTSTAITVAEDRDTEVEFSIKATTNAKAGQTYCFRGTKNGIALDAYNRYAELTVAGTTNTAPTFTSVPSDNGSATTTPTIYGQNVNFTATSTDAQGDQYYLAICKTNSILAGNGGAPTCLGGSWCVSGRASSTKVASCSVNTAHFNSEYYNWYGFACDYHYGAGIAQCSPVSQGTVGSPNASPFRVNHPPVYSAVTVLTDNQDPGSMFNIQATAADTDSSSSLNYFICKNNSATASGCTGGSGSTYCSAVATTTANPICHYQTPLPDPSGAYNFYAFVFDNFSLAATTSPISSSFHVNNTPPVLGSLSINSNNDITLNIKGAPDTPVQLLNTSVTDLNGCQTLVSATGVVYRTGVGYNCAADNNNCYQIIPANCVISNCSGPTSAIATYTCNTSLKYYAQPTDNSTNNPWSSDTWSGRLQVYDGANYVATTSPTIELNTNLALNVPQTTISFGTVDPGTDTGSYNQTTTVINYGNSPLNSNISGTDMTGVPTATLQSTYIHWDLTQGFTYSTGNTLKNGGEIVSVNLAKPASEATSSNSVYWGIGIPSDVTHAVYHGTSVFSAVLNNLGW